MIDRANATWRRYAIGSGQRTLLAESARLVALAPLAAGLTFALGGLLSLIEFSLAQLVVLNGAIAVAMVALVLVIASSQRPGGRLRVWGPLAAAALLAPAAVGTALAGFAVVVLVPLSLVVLVGALSLAGHAPKFSKLMAAPIALAASTGVLALASLPAAVLSVLAVASVTAIIVHVNWFRAGSVLNFLYYVLVYPAVLLVVLAWFLAPNHPMASMLVIPAATVMLSIVCTAAAAPLNLLLPRGMLYHASWMLAVLAVGLAVFDAALAPLAASAGLALAAANSLSMHLRFLLLVTGESSSPVLPCSGSSDFTIYREAPGAERTMDLLLHSASALDEFMGDESTSLATIVYFQDGPIIDGKDCAGATVPIIDLRFISSSYDVDDGGDDAGRAAYVIAHEMAHQYWCFNQEWLNEGAANVLAAISESKRTGARPTVDNPSPNLAQAGSISELEGLSPPPGHPAYVLNYSLGERLFLNLYYTLGEGAFRRGMRELYARSRNKFAGIDDVRAAFKAGVTDHCQQGGRLTVQRAMECVDSITARWYDGVNIQAGPRPLDTQPVDPHFPGGNGSIARAYLGYEGNQPQTRFPAEDRPSPVRLYVEVALLEPDVQTEIEMEIVAFVEEFGYESELFRFVTKTNRESTTSWSIPVWPNPKDRIRPGRYWISLFQGNAKVADVDFLVGDV